MKETKFSLGGTVFGLLSFLLLTILDQLSKQWAVLRLKGQASIVLVKNVFQLYYLENHGAAFGILQGRRLVFLVITVIVLILLIYVYLRLPFTRKYRMLRTFLVLIAAGAVGNFIDRLTQNYVVDFFYFELIDFPVFNVADIYVTCATVLLVIFVIFGMKDEDFTEIAQALGLSKKNTNSEGTDA